MIQGGSRGMRSGDRGVALAAGQVTNSSQEMEDVAEVDQMVFCSRSNGDNSLPCDISRIHSANDVQSQPVWVIRARTRCNEKGEIVSQHVPHGLVIIYKLSLLILPPLRLTSVVILYFLHGRYLYSYYV